MGTHNPKLVDKAWKRISRHFRQYPTSPLTPKSASVIEVEVLEHLTRLWGRSDLQMTIPEEYLYFLSLSPTGWICDKDGGFNFYSPNGVIRRTTQGYSSLTEDDFDIVLGPQTIWIQIGDWADKHDIFLCCDPTDSQYGFVLDCNDGHPWLAPISCYTPAFSFVDYLNKLRF